MIFGIFKMLDNLSVASFKILRVDNFLLADALCGISR
jgi:hypothetical protein